MTGRYVIVTVCTVCLGTKFRRYGYHCAPGDSVATEFAECLGCYEVYLYKCPAIHPPSPKP